MRWFFISLFVISNSFANPSWYGKLKNTEVNSYIGYGSSIDSAISKREALNDIVSQISVNIDTSFSDRMTEINGNISNVSELKTSQNSQAVLNDYKLLKSEYSDGKYFVAIGYENIPSLDKFVKKVKASGVKKSAKQNSYLKNTPIAKKLHNMLQKDIEFNLLRKDKKWYIKSHSILQPLDSKDFARFFTTQNNPHIKIQTNKKRDILYDGDRFFFKVQTKQKGFVSILSVYEDGTVATLVRNIPIDKNSLENIPDADFETIPEAGLIIKGVETYDLYVAVFSKKKIRFDNFAYADEKLISEEKYKNFDELISFLDGKSYSALKVVTKPRK